METQVLQAGTVAKSTLAEQTPAESLKALIKCLIAEQQYEGVAVLFNSASEAQSNLLLMEKISNDLLHEVCLPNLSAVIHESNPQLYACADDLLKIIAAQGPCAELLLELLELVEESDSEFVFTTALRAMQVVLFRIDENKSRGLMWALNSIHTRILRLPLPNQLEEGYDSQQQALLEQHAEVQSLLTYYVTVGLFYRPLLEDLLQKVDKPKALSFRDCNYTRRNVFCCFFIQLLGKPLALLDLSLQSPHPGVNKFTAQVARNLTESAMQCLKGDPFYLLQQVETRLRWERRLDSSKGVYEMSARNIFLVEEHLSLLNLAIYHYMLLVELDITTAQEAQVPSIYAPLFLYEASLYLANVLLHCPEPALQQRGVLLARRALTLLEKHSVQVPAIVLELKVHKQFCQQLTKIVGYAEQLELRRTGVQLLRSYILQFDDEGKYLLLRELLRTVTHNGLTGYLATLYKDLVALALKASAEQECLPASFSSDDFRVILLQHICQLPRGVETDLLDHSDQVISALNAVRFFALNDCHNRTGFWNIVPHIEAQFLEPLRKGLNLSVSHYKEVLQREISCETAAQREVEHERLKLLDVSIANDILSKTRRQMRLDRDQKIGVLKQHLCTFDLMQSILGRTTECLEHALTQRNKLDHNASITSGLKNNNKNF